MAYLTKSGKSAVNFSQYTALLVDDVENMRITTSRMLHDMGFGAVHAARNGMEAWAYLQEHKVDLVISEWVMPKMDGMTLLNKVRENASTKELPFIMSTTLIEQESVKLALKAGVSEYIAKPFNFARLSRHVEKAFLDPLNKRLKGKSLEDVKPGSEPKPQKSYSILVVDDRENHPNLLTVLKSLGKVGAVCNGRETLAICCSDKPPSLVLLSTSLSGSNGLNVMEMLKDHPKTHDIPVIFLTEKFHTSSVVNGYELGAVDYINRPIDATELKIRVLHQKRLWQYQQSHKTQLQTMIDNLEMRENLECIIQHDLHNPLAAIVAHAEDTTRHLADTRRVANNTQCILSTAQIGCSMVLNLFNTIKVKDSGYSVEQTSFELLPILNQVMTTFNRKISDKRLLIKNEVSELTRVLGDKSLTYSLFANLLINAVDAAPEESTIEISEHYLPTQVQIEVYNLGAVPESVRPRFFHQFATEGKSSGKGIGTYAAKLFCQIQNGSLDVIFEEEATRVIVKMCKETT